MASDAPDSCSTPGQCWRADLAHGIGWPTWVLSDRIAGAFTSGGIFRSTTVALTLTSDEQVRRLAEFRPSAPLPSGRTFTSLELIAIARTLDGVDQFRFVQRAPGDLVVQVATLGGVPDSDLESLKSRIAGALCEPVRPEVEVLDHTPVDGTRFQPFVTRQ